MPTSGHVPVKTSEDSPNTLPIRGYSMDQLADYLFRCLGSPTWNVELTKQQVLDCIQDALNLFSERVPLRRPMALQLTHKRYRYLEDEDVGYGVADVSFVEVLPPPTAILYANLINPAPILRTGLDEYDTFLRWQKTWQRVASVKPDWFYDDYVRALYIHNPIERYRAGVLCFFPYPNTESLPPVGARWVKEYALAKAQYLLGSIFMKFSGAIPGPVKDVQLDSQKRDLAQAEMDKLKEELKGMSTGAGIFID